MIKTFDNADVFLFEDLVAALERDDGGVCLTISFSKILKGKARWHSILSDILREAGYGEQARVYICHDEDVFVLIPALSKRAFDILIFDLSQRTGLDTLPAYAQRFSIENDWLELEILCQRKLKAFRRHCKEEAEKTRQRAEIEHCIAGLDKRLTESIAARRLQRENIEILVADDDLITRTLVKNILSRDYMVHFAEDGKEALQNYVARAPDVFFLDIGLPDMDGHEVLQHIFRFDPQAYVVMFSSRKDEGNVMRAIDAGAQGYLIKPFSMEKLAGYIRKSPFIRNKAHAS